MKICRIWRREKRGDRKDERRDKAGEGQMGQERRGEDKGEEVIGRKGEEARGEEGRVEERKKRREEEGGREGSCQDTRGKAPGKNRPCLPSPRRFWK